MNIILRDFGAAFRNVRRDGSFSLAAISVLGLALAAAVSVFSLVHGILVKPLGLIDSDRLVAISERREGAALASRISPLVLTSWQQQDSTLSALAAYFTDFATLSEGDDPQRILVANVSGDFFKVLGMPISAGRGLEPGDLESQAVVVAKSLFRQLYGPRYVDGQVLRMDGRAALVVGVADDCCLFPENVSIWRSSAIRGEGPGSSIRYLSVVGRLADSTPGPQVATESLGAISLRLAGRAPALQRYVPVVTPLHQELTGAVSRPLEAFFVAVLMLTLLACCSVANMMVARTAARKGELAIRAAVGATRLGLVRQLVFEAVLIATIAGVGAFLVAGGALAVVSLRFGALLPRLREVSLDPTVLCFTVAMCVLAVVAIVPAALAASTPDVASSLREGAATLSRGRTGQLIQRGLLSIEFAVALTLLVAAGLSIRSFWQLSAIDPGFATDGLITAEVILPASRYPRDRVGSFYDGIFQRAGGNPLIRSMGVASSTPLAGGAARRRLIVEGAQADAADEEVNNHVVTAGYLPTLGVSFLLGRDFEMSETVGASPVAVINRALRERYFGTRDPIGQQVQFDDGLGRRSLTIIGVVSDLRDMGLTTAAGPQIYTTTASILRPAIIARTERDSDSAARDLKAIIRSVDPQLAVNVRSLNTVVNERLQQPELRTLVTSVFASLSLAVAFAGLASLVLFQVRTRSAELAIRLACGAPRRHVIACVARETLVAALFGIALGAVCSLILGRLASLFLYDVEPNDPVALIGGAFVLVAGAAGVSYLAARRASILDPRVLMNFGSQSSAQASIRSAGRAGC